MSDELRASRNDFSPLYERRGGAISGLVMTLSIIGLLTLSAMIIAPRYLEATPGGWPAAGLRPARLATHQEFIDTLAGLVGRSVGVLAVHRRGSTPYEEVVLWLEDDKKPGRLGERELAVLSHSRVLHTISLFRLSRDAQVAVDNMGIATAISKPAFCDAFRTDPRVIPLILATGVSDMQLEPLGRPVHGTQRLRISLTWTQNSADGPDAASVVVDAVMSPFDTQG